LVDGSGIAHPRRGGIASLLGVLAQRATIGVTKSHLYGQVDVTEMKPGEKRLITDGDETIGAAIRPRLAGRHMLYVSPGHQISVRQAIHLTMKWLGARALPEPIYWADRLSRAAARIGAAQTI
jgi:deoxyribonuclease V